MEGSLRTYLRVSQVLARIIEVEVESLSNCRILAPIISSALLLSHNIRRDTLLIIHSNNDNKSLVVDGKIVRNLRPDFESMCGLINSALRMKTRYGIVLKDGKISHNVHVLYLDTGKGLNIINAVRCYGKAGSYALYIGRSTPHTRSSNVVHITFGYDYCIPQKLIIFNYMIDKIEQGMELCPKKI